MDEEEIKAWKTKKKSNKKIFIILGMIVILLVCSFLVFVTVKKQYCQKRTEEQLKTYNDWVAKTGVRFANRCRAGGFRAPQCEGYQDYFRLLPGKPNAEKEKILNKKCLSQK